MKHIILTAFFLLSITAIASACSMICCAGKTECCCAEKKKQSADEQIQYESASENLGIIQLSDLANCSCKEHSPLPVAEAGYSTILSNKSSSKLIPLSNQIDHAAIKPSSAIACSIEFSLLKSYRGPTTAMPLRI